MRKHISIVCLLLCLLWACSKDNELSGPPVVNAVSLLDSTKVDSTFTRALPGTMLLISGNNLSGITSISFNNMEAYFNPTYNTSTHVIITIPDNAPTEATDPEVPNQIHIKTTHGETMYNFVVDIPPPAIYAISNENALAGDSLIIFGASLWLIDKISFPGGRDVTDLSADPAGTRVGLVMPDLGTDTGRITIHAKYGSVSSHGPLNDHQSANLLSNLTEKEEEGETPVFNWAWWGANRTSDAALFPGTRGAYLQNVFGGVGANDGGWWNGNRSGNFDEVQRFTAADVNKQASDYALKFEMNTKEPWKAGICVLRFNDGPTTYAFRFIPFNGAPGNTFDTENRWITITVVLSEFKATADGKEGMGGGAASLASLIKPDGKVAFGYRFITEDAPVEVFNTAFDNFRIIKIR